MSTHPPSAAVGHTRDFDEPCLTEWLAQHDIDGWLLPLGTRKDDPIELVRTFTEFFEQTPQYQATFTTTEVGQQFHSGYAEAMVRLFGLREVDSTNRKNRYVNPNYAHIGHHEPAIKDNDARLAFYDRYKCSPFVDGEWFAANFGVSTSYIWDWFSRRGISWSEQRQANRERLGRTLYTIDSWDTNDHGPTDLGEAFPAPSKTVQGWLYYHGRGADDWEPPAYPSDEDWHRKHNGNADARSGND